MQGRWISRTPLYLQVVSALVKRIADGTWKAGTAVPNEMDLGRELGVSPGTVRKALNHLEAERVVTRRPGRGTFVNDQASDELAARFCRLRCRDGRPIWGDPGPASIAEGAATERECKRLRLEAGEKVYRVRRTRDHGRRTVMVEELALPAALFPGLDTKLDVGDLNALARDYGILLGKAWERMAIVPAPMSVAGDLGIPPETPILFLDRVVCALEAERPVEWRTAYCHLPDGYYLAEIA